MYLYLCVICLVFAALFLKAEMKEKYGSAVVLKGLASLCFVIFGVLGSKVCRDPRFAKLVVIGLILGAVADVLLNLRYVVKKNGKIVFLLGILVFLAGHVLYIAALIPRCKSLSVCIAAGAVLTAGLLAWIFKQITAEKAFKIFGVVYIGVITIMNCISLGALIADPSAQHIVFFAGALLFLASDIILILNTFGGKTKSSLRIANIALYYVGQLLIALCLQL